MLCVCDRRISEQGDTGRSLLKHTAFYSGKTPEIEARGYNFVTGWISALRRRNSAYTVPYSPKTPAVRQNRRNDTRKLL
jgi:hypothetical protein